MPDSPKRPDAAPQLTSAKSAPHYWWGERCEGWRLVDNPSLSVIEEQVPPGGHEKWHVHDLARQFFYLIAGQAEMRTPAGTVTLTPNTGVEIAPGLAHQFANVGPAPARFIVVSAPSTREDRRPAVDS